MGCGDFFLSDAGRRSAPIKAKTLTKLPTSYEVDDSAGRERLWALGYETLEAYRIAEKGGRVELASTGRWYLPSDDGHDLSPRPGRDELYVTTASTGLTDAEGLEQPLAGALFLVDPGTRVRPTDEFGG